MNVTHTLNTQTQQGFRADSFFPPNTCFDYTVKTASRNSLHLIYSFLQYTKVYASELLDLSNYYTFSIFYFQHQMQITII